MQLLWQKNQPPSSSPLPLIGVSQGRLAACQGSRLVDSFPPRTSLSSVTGHSEPAEIPGLTPVPSCVICRNGSLEQRPRPAKLPSGCAHTGST